LIPLKIAEKIRLVFSTFNSPEGIRLIDTKFHGLGNVPYAKAFNSPEGIRLIDTFDSKAEAAYYQEPFNSPEGIRLIDTAMNISYFSARRPSTFNSPEGIRLIDTQVGLVRESSHHPLSTPLRELDSLIHVYPACLVLDFNVFQLP